MIQTVILIIIILIIIITIGLCEVYLYANEIFRMLRSSQKRINLNTSHWQGSNKLQNNISKQSYNDYLILHNNQALKQTTGYCK